MEPTPLIHRLPNEVLIHHIIPFMEQFDRCCLAYSFFWSRDVLAALRCYDKKKMVCCAIDKKCIWLVKQLCHEPSIISKEIFYGACSSGDLELIQWIAQHVNIPNDALGWVFCSNNLEAMKWLREQGCCLSKNVFNNAALYGHFEIMKWLHENNCPWDRQTFARAAKNGNLDIMKWMKEKGCNWDRYTFVAAAESGNAEALQWLEDNDCPITTDVLFGAMRSKNTRVMDWARKYVSIQGVRNTIVGTMLVAFKNKCTDTLEWITKQSFYDDAIAKSDFTSPVSFTGTVLKLRISPIFTDAVICGNLNVMNWLWKRKFPMGVYAIQMALKEGSVEKLEWLINHNCSCEVKYFCFVRHSKVAKWLLKNIDEAALAKGHHDRYYNLNYIKWLAGESYKPSKFLLTSAIRLNKKEAARKLIREGCTISKWNLMFLIEKNWFFGPELKDPANCQTVKKKLSVQHTNVYTKYNLLLQVDSFRGEGLRFTAAKVGNLRMMTLLDTIDRRMTKAMIKPAIMNGNLKNLQWLKENDHFKRIDCNKLLHCTNNKHVIKWMNDNLQTINKTL
jgi:hypothetical protein